MKWKKGKKQEVTYHGKGQGDVPEGVQIPYGLGDAGKEAYKEAKEKEAQAQWKKHGPKVLTMSRSALIPLKKSKGPWKRGKRLGIASEATTGKVRDDAKLEAKQRGIKPSREDTHPKGGHMWD